MNLKFDSFKPNTIFDVLFYNEAEQLAFTVAGITTNPRGVAACPVPQLDAGYYTAYLVTSTTHARTYCVAYLYHDGYDAVSAEVAQLLNKEIDAGYSMAEITRLSAAALLGKSSQNGAITTFKGLDGTTTRITATTTQEGDRTAITLNKNV